MEWQAEESVNGRHAERCVHEERPQHRSSQDRRPHMACAPRYRTFFFSASKNLLTSRSESATKALEPNNSQLAVTRSCKRIDAGFPLPSIHRRRESGHSNARGCPVAVLSSRHPRTQSLRLACVDAKLEAEMSGVAATGVRKRQASRGVRP